jgi:hypothetical protein
LSQSMFSYFDDEIEELRDHVARFGRPQPPAPASKSILSLTDPPPSQAPHSLRHPHPRAPHRKKSRAVQRLIERRRSLWFRQLSSWRGRLRRARLFHKSVVQAQLAQFFDRVLRLLKRRGFCFCQHFLPLLVQSLEFLESVQRFPPRRQFL